MSKKKKTPKKNIEAKLYKFSDDSNKFELMENNPSEFGALDLVNEIDQSSKWIKEILSITEKLRLADNHILNQTNPITSAFKELGVYNNPIFDLTKSFMNLGAKLEQQEKELQKYWLYNLTVDDLEFTTQRLKDTQLELNNLKNEFRKMYEKLEPQPVITSQKIHKYSFECLLSPNELKAMYVLCSQFFECSYNQIVDIFSSDDIDTQIKIKPEGTIREIVFLFKSLKDGEIIKTKQWANIIVKSKCILFNNKPLTSQQLKDANKSLRKKDIKSESETLINQSITNIK